ncbi:MAG: helix-turn-helix domain-containing protein, partial [Defluviitaleaceae bacterium]|nr:helix-turn-helix domain-containing protein [Defluviitaleaceae bacterium]
KENGYTQDALAEKLGVTAQAISKWENGHTVPETPLLPQLAKLFNCSIDAILLPYATQDNTFKEFLQDAVETDASLMMKLYSRMKGKVDFAISYRDEFHVFNDVAKGKSASLTTPELGEGFIIRVDYSREGGNGHIMVRVPLINCGSYMDKIEKMPEYIKKKFRADDCTACSGHNCPARMAYTFEGKGYKQCYFITMPIMDEENLEHIWSLLRAEYGL